jgi:VCBS repeat-containing protein
MSKIYNLRVNESSGTEGQTVSVTQGMGDKGAPVRVLAQRGARYELQDDAKAKGAAPDQVRVKRVGKNLHLLFDGSQNADVVLENFYAEGNTTDGGLPVLAGQAENGSVYEYIPQDPAFSSVTHELADGNTPVMMALGGGALGEIFALSALPLVAAAAGGVSGWAVAGAAVGAAALAGGGGGSGGAGVLPSGQKGYLTRSATHDTGVSSTDGYTQNNKPQLTINAESGAKVVVTVNGKEYEATETNTKGVYTVDVGSKETLAKLADGVYTPIIKVTNAAGFSTVNGDPFTIDTSTTSNEDGKKNPSHVPDENSQSAVTINLGSIDTNTGSLDTGSSATDFVTSDGTLSFQGKVSGFVSNGDKVHLVVLDSANVAVVNQYVSPNNTGDWSFNNQSNTLPIGNYTIKASLEDLAGNAVKKAADQPLTVALVNTLVVRPEAVSVLEKDIVSKVAANGVLANDGDTTASAVKVTKIINSDVVGSGAVTVTGLYGQIDMFADGHYEYRQTNNSLTAGQKVVDTFTYEVQAVGTTRTQTATLTMDITGVNDNAVMTAVNTTPIDVSNLASVTSVNPAITITDADDNEAAIQGVSANGSTSNSGSLGTLTTNGGAQAQGNYDFLYAKSGGVAVGTSQHDLFSFTSMDATANRTLDFVIAGSGPVTMHEFNVAPLGNEHSVKGLKATGTISTTDTLKLHGSTDTSQQTTFDFSDPVISTFESIEKIEILGNGPNTVRLSLASLTQGDSVNTQSQTLFINGDTNDALYFTSSIQAVDLGLENVDNVSYHKYSFGDGQFSDQLLVQATITSITFNG